jgi:hypothetical protein
MLFPILSRPERFHISDGTAGDGVVGHIHGIATDAVDFAMQLSDRDQRLRLPVPRLGAEGVGAMYRVMASRRPARASSISTCSLGVEAP